MTSKERQRTLQASIQRERSCDRDHRISYLGDVLQKQRQTIKHLLSGSKEKGCLDSTKSRRNTGAEEHKRSKETDNTRRVNGQNRQLYQRLSADIIDHGNKLLSSGHLKTNSIYTEKVRSPLAKPLSKHTTGQFASQVEIKLPVQELEERSQTFDHGLQYLKSSDYRLYLERIAQQGQISPKVSQDRRSGRTHEAYLRPSRADIYSGRSSNRPSRRAVEPRRLFKDRDQNVPDKVKIEERVEDTLNLDLNALKKQLEVLTASPVAPLKPKTMTYTPTMGQIETVPQPVTPEIEPFTRRPLVQNIKIQSNTINLCMQLTASEEKKRRQHIEHEQKRAINHFQNEKQEDKNKYKNSRKKLKDVIDYKINDKVSPASEALQVRIENQRKKKEKVIEDYTLFYGKEKEEDHYDQRKQDIKIDQYKIDFKLTRPVFSQNRSGRSKQKQNAKPVLSKQNKIYYDPGIDSKRVNFMPNPTKHTMTVHTIPQEQRQPFLQSCGSTSTMTREGAQTPTKSQSKLSVITPSRKSKK